MNIIKSRLVKLGLPLLVLGVAGILAWQINDSAPKAGRRVPQAQPRLVDVQPVIREDVKITVTGLGTVIPSRQLLLYPEVTGLVKTMRNHLLPGSQIHKGETLVEIDPLEYQIQLEKQKAEVALADSELQKEMGQQTIARQEFELIGQALSPEQKALVLRQPQLDAAQAKLAQAKAALAQAQMNLDRTRIKAPFNAQVISRNIETGSRVSTGSEIMDIVATDQFWLEVEIPVEQLQWLSFGDALEGKSEEKSGEEGLVTISSPSWLNKTRTGHLLSFSPSLHSGSRMAKVIIAIDDPLALRHENQGKPRVLINDLVRAEINGQEIANAVVVPDALFRNGNQVWLIDSNKNLEIRTLEPVYRDSVKAIVATGVATGLNDGDSLITSTLTVAVQGMPLRTASDDRQQAQKKASGQSPMLAGGE